MMTAESCQCEIPRQPHTAGRYGAYHGQYTSGFLAGVDSSGPFPFKTSEGMFLEAISNGTSVRDKPDTWESEPVGSINPGGCFPIVAASNETSASGEPKNPGDLDAVWYLIADPDTKEKYGWVKAIRYIKDLDGKLYATTYVNVTDADVPMTEGELATAKQMKSNGEYATDDVTKAVLAAGKPVGANTPQGAAPSSGSSDWTSWFSGWGFGTTVQPAAAANPPEEAKKADEKAKAEGTSGKKGSGGGGGGAAALGLGALALLLLSSK